MNILPLLLTHFGATATCDPNKTFFGIPVWYKYIIKSPSAGACDFSNVRLWPPTDLMLIGVVAIDILLRIAGMVAFFYVVYGGIQYVTSQGEPDRLKQASNTIINALIGLAITAIAVTSVAFLGNRLGG